MRRVVVSVLLILLVLSIVGYAGGLFTGEVRREESCLLCRATRYSGRHYGFAYERIEDSVLTDWYRKTIDPLHGREPDHPHQWQQSACTVTVHPFVGNLDYTCTSVAPIFLLRPEIEMEVLQRIPDPATQVALLHSLNSPSRKMNTRRIRLLIEYYYIDKDEMPWNQWWQKHAAEFGLAPARTVSTPQ
jgi:hypothetical protein